MFGWFRKKAEWDFRVDFEDTKLSSKKREEVQGLLYWMRDLIKDHSFHKLNDFGTSAPWEARIEKEFSDDSLWITPLIDISGQNYDRVGKITISIGWRYQDEEWPELTLRKAMEKVENILSTHS